MTTPGALTESSVSRQVATHDRKGREGKGKWKNRAELSIHDLRRGSAELMDGRSAAMSRGAR